MILFLAIICAVIFACILWPLWPLFVILLLALYGLTAIVNKKCGKRPQ